ncbi:MAG: MATE family efflux transporter, partial [Eggerthellaceae bacterium]|nr:MATE family efflux transporter [Eggerthellaceae bacterium]
MEAEEAADRALGAPGEGAGAPLGQDPKNSHRDSKVTRMGTASIPKLIVEFAIPAIGGMLVNGAYNIIDSIFLGQAMGEIGLSAVTVANPIMVIFIAISMLVGVGGNALASLRLGEGKRVDAETSLGNTVFLTLILWVLVIALVSVPLTLNGLLTLSSATDEIRPYAASFIRIIAFGFIFQGIGFGVNNFIRTAGAPNRALVTMIMGAVSCIILNYIFVMQMHMGVQGSALATVCGQAVSCASVLWYFTMTKNVPLRLHLKYMRPQLKFVKKILSFGLASFFVQAGAAL